MMSFTAGHFYHIYNRGSGRQPIFFEDENYYYLLRLFKKYSQIMRITVIAYCLMPNHFHLLIRQNGDVKISKLILKLCTGYTKYFQKKYGHTGHLLQAAQRRREREPRMGTATAASHVVWRARPCRRVALTRAGRRQARMARRDISPSIWRSAST